MFTICHRFSEISSIYESSGTLLTLTGQNGRAVLLGQVDVQIPQWPINGDRLSCAIPRSIDQKISISAL